MERWDQLYTGGYRFCFGDGAFKPSTDTFLLGGFVQVRRGERVCDLGAGIGLPGLLQTLGAQGRTRPLALLGPAGLADIWAAVRGSSCAYSRCCCSYWWEWCSCARPQVFWVR